MRNNGRFKISAASSFGGQSDILHQKTRRGKPAEAQPNSGTFCFFFFFLIRSVIRSYRARTVMDLRFSRFFFFPRSVTPSVHTPVSWSTSKTAKSRRRAAARTLMSNANGSISIRCAIIKILPRAFLRQTTFINRLRFFFFFYRLF